MDLLSIFILVYIGGVVLGGFSITYILLTYDVIVIEKK